ncbi:MIR domain protein [Ichthyophthirius multifiliis]|uniref:MIR domain protein n=1 Tax=Ichthyophthirius multifiliis TaxID=5932 RepID=G0QMJ5_ICHMU|nr:MIR domain protein [Ichthyophthirius multifiliis]EGR33561.1 MIR domain protein [Ichthyophthirius multifiliis]|eukprot:XP_004037547.1 MIR domain protein [Ichthyophthirius multifiliis]
MIIQDQKFGKNIQITYGCCITLNLADYQNYYIQSDGFLQSKLSLKNYSQPLGNKFVDFRNCVFKILPPLDHNYVQSMLKATQSQDINNETSLQKRKAKIRMLQQNLNAELNSNMTTCQKLNGTSVLFTSSSFHLVHVASIKFLSLTKDQSNNYIFTLEDFANQQTLFKFLPCLTIQKQRANIVMNRDTINLCNIALIHNRKSFLYTNFQGQKIQENINNLIDEEYSHASIYANLENASRWVVNIYSNDEAEENSRFLNIGSVVQLNLSEKNVNKIKRKQQKQKQKSIVYHVVVKMKIQKIFQRIIKDIQKKMISKNLKLVCSQATQENNIFQDLEKINPDLNQIQKKEFDLNNEQLTNLKHTINEKYEVLYEQTVYSQNSPIYKQNVVPNIKALWIIESTNIYNGGLLKWENTFRLKHFITGKYLCVRQDYQNSDNNYLDLTSSDEKGSVFKFLPLKQTENNKKFITKDSFFQIQHFQSEQTISYKEIKDCIQTRLEKNNNNYKINIFKIKKTNFEDTWETNFLLFTMPVILNTIKIINLFVFFFFNYFIQFHFRISKLKVSNGNQGMFLGNIQIKLTILFMDQIILLIINLLHISIFMKSLPQQVPQDKMQIHLIIYFKYYQFFCQKENKLIREQQILGALCLLLQKIYPNIQDFQQYAYTTDLQKEYLNIYKQNQWPIKHEFNLNQEQVEEDDYIKLQQEFFGKRYGLSYNIYMLLQCICKENTQNQQYLLKFIYTFIPHIGFGKFVCDALSNIYFKNIQILQEIQNIQLKSQQNQQQLAVNTEKKSNLLNELILKFNQFPNFVKPELIQLLADCCVLNNVALYQHQKYIYNRVNIISIQINLFQYFNLGYFKSLDIKNLFDECIFQEKSLQQQLINICKEEDIPISDFLQNKEKKRRKSLVQYLKSQLNLFTNLCKNRNNIACFFIRDQFPLEVLSYSIIKQDESDPEILAKFLKIIQNVYIDIFPRQAHTKPNLIKKLFTESEYNTQQQKLNNVINNESYDNNNQSAEEIVNNGGKIKNFAVVSKVMKQISKMTLKTVKMPDKALDNTQININNDINQEMIERNHLNQLKEYLIQYLEDRNTQLQKIFQKNDDNINDRDQKKNITNSIYNNFTLECIEILQMMVQFELVDEKENLQKLNGKNGNNQGILNKIFIQNNNNGNINEINKERHNSELERIIKCLVNLLEFDEKYFQELQGLQILRKYQEVQLLQENNQGLKNVLRQGIQIGKLSQLGGKLMGNMVGNMFMNDNQQKQKKQAKIMTNLDSQNELVQEPIFKKVQGLKKILMKYTNKTFSIREENKEFECENLIKISICNFLSHLLDIRQDFFIDNAICYFQQKFAMYKKEEDYNKLDNDLKEILPNIMTGVGKEVQKEQIKNYTQNKFYLRGFDEILSRSFIECLLFSFYIAQNSDLENSIIKLIKRCVERKEEFFNNILQLEVIFTQQDNYLYQVMSDFIITLKNLTQESQIWLNVDDYLNQPKEQEQINQAIIKLIIGLKTRQNIFNHIGGRQCLIELNEKVLNVLEKHMDDIFFDFSENNYKIKLIKISFSIMISLCQNNKENQEVFFNKYFRYLQKFQKINIGQIEFTQEILKYNYFLTLNLTNKDLSYYLDMIKINGKHYQFLEIFNVLLLKETESQDQEQIQKVIIESILDYGISHFYNEQIDINKYKSIFLIVKFKYSFLFKKINTNKGVSKNFKQ